jgi:hypothetical protein
MKKNNQKTVKLTFDDLLEVVGGAQEALGDKTFQQEKYNKKRKLQDGPEGAELHQSIEVPADSRPVSRPKGSRD